MLERAVGIGSQTKVRRVGSNGHEPQAAGADLKGELGLDHFEGRSFVGWHRPVSVVLCCYASVVAEQMRAFPPSC